MRKLILLFLVVQSCDNQPSTLSETSSEVLNSIIQNTSHQIINLDKVQTDEVFINESNIILDINQLDSLFIGHIESVVKRKDKIYFYDLITKAVYILHEDGKIHGPVTREGKGPGEHDVISNLALNSSYIYLGDLNNARVNRYTHEMNSIDPITDFFSGRISVNDEKIIYQNHASSGFSPSKPDQGLVGISSVNNLSDTLKTIMPRIIPSGYQPQVFNNVNFSMNNHNHIAASYTPLPWIFLYDKNHELENLLVLNYSEFDKLDLPEMDLFKPRSNMGYGGQVPINHYVLMDNGDLYVTLRNEVTHLVRVNSNKYEVIKRYKIVHEDDSGSNVDESFLWTFNKVFYSNEEYAMVFNTEYIYRILLN